MRGVLACLALALRKVRRLALSDAQRTPLHIIDYAAEQIGGHLLGAQCVDDLEERLDALLEEPALLHVNALLLEAVRPELLDAAPESLQLADLAEEVFGAGQRSLLNEGERLSLATMGAIGPLLGAMTAEQRRDMSRSLAQFSPLALWTDPGTPATVAGALVGALRSTVCMLAVVQALSNNRKLEPWHARAILDRWVEGMRRHLSLLASMPGVLVGEDIVATVA
ncbi:MAG: hypothetical protein HY744_26550 [Deltaproteobacteria bacterium]|nr:hypothetical protein [Deltaproteobacteria bacterium]